MKYSNSNKPIQCIMKNSTCYKGTGKATPVGVLWHSTGANNPNLKRYVQPYETDSNYNEMIALLGKNNNKNDWNHIKRSAGVNAWIGKLADGTVATVQTLPWDYAPWGCGAGKNGSCNGRIGGKHWIQFEIAEDSLTDPTYFNKVYKEACELTAYLCDMYNLDPCGTVNVNGVKTPVILCHADSYKLGLGSNHSDVYHWFNKHGKTMDDVRKDVAALINKPVATKPSISTGTSTSSPSSTSSEIYRVRKSWKDSKTQIGAYRDLKNAKVACDKAGSGYYIFNSNGTVVYPTVSSYKVKVIADALNIRKNAGLNYSVVGVIKNKGVYTIVDESTDKNGIKWGLLKAYEKNRNGWISLNTKYVKKI